MNHENHSRKKRSKIFFVIPILILILIAGGASLVYIQTLGAPLDKEDATAVTVTIASGLGTGDIAAKLTEEGIIDSADRFKLWSRIKGYDSQYKAGTYSLSPSMSYDEIATVLVGGLVDTFVFTIPEGYTIEQVAETLAAQDLADKDVFLQLAASSQFDEEFPFLKEAQAGENHLEGYLFPNTYTLATGSTEEDIIRIMLTEFRKEVGETEEIENLNKIIIMASIIEREAMLDEERPLVASVIYNRLNLGMSLQMCSTVQYILGEPKAVLTNADTQIDSPYNTYINTGLPPGPICSPGLTSIEAAMSPADTDYLYFVLSEKLDGTSNFSSDYNQFLQDKAAYYKAYEASN